jgi:hypothetical protein
VININIGCSAPVAVFIPMYAPIATPLAFFRNDEKLVSSGGECSIMILGLSKNSENNGPSIASSLKRFCSIQI